LRELSAPELSSSEIPDIQIIDYIVFVVLQLQDDPSKNIELEIEILLHGKCLGRYEQKREAEPKMTVKEGCKTLIKSDRGTYNV
jgi:hypothetical protein